MLTHDAPHRFPVSMSTLKAFIDQHRITEVECLVPDVNGVARGKILPDDKFLRGMATRGLRVPESIFIQTVTGGYPRDEDVTDPPSSTPPWCRTRTPCASCRGTRSRRPR
jgi:hypothetical protein